MKLLLVVCALIGFAAAAQLPDSATQGPNPQDIATPEPEYIDIDGPEPAAPAPAPISSLARSSNFISGPITHPVQRPSITHFAPVQQRSFAPVANQLPGHIFSRQSGYQYRRPVYVRRFYRRRF